MKSKATPLRDKACSKSHVVTVDERTSIAMAIHHREVDGITGSEWFSFQILGQTTIRFYQLPPLFGIGLGQHSLDRNFDLAGIGTVPP